MNRYLGMFVSMCNSILSIPTIVIGKWLETNAFALIASIYGAAAALWETNIRALDRAEASFGFVSTRLCYFPSTKLIGTGSL